MASSYHQLGIVAQKRGELNAAHAWCIKALAIDEKLGNRLGMASSYGQLGLLAVWRGDHAQAFEWMVRAVAVLPAFPHPMTVSALEVLVPLTAAHSMAALEESWLRVTGQPSPGSVRSYVEDRICEGTSESKRAG